MTAPIPRRQTDAVCQRRISKRLRGSAERSWEKGTFYAPASFDELLGCYSKAALVDALWCACQLGTNESTEEITIRAAREMQIALRTRGDRVRPALVATAALPLDGD